jgi:hypothetical protein
MLLIICTHINIGICLELIKYLIQDVEEGNVVVDFNGPFVVREQVHNVGHSGGNPASSLVVKLIETFWTVRVRIAGCRVLNPVPTLQ